MADARTPKTPAKTAAPLRPLPPLQAAPKREPIDVTASQIIEVIEVK